MQADGKILIGGSFTTIGGVRRNGIARLNPDGSVDRFFGVLWSAKVSFSKFKVETLRIFDSC